MNTQYIYTLIVLHTFCNSDIFIVNQATHPSALCPHQCALKLHDHLPVHWFFWSHPFMVFLYWYSSFDILLCSLNKYDGSCKISKDSMSSLMAYHVYSPSMVFPSISINPSNHSFLGCLPVSHPMCSMCIPLRWMTFPSQYVDLWQSCLVSYSLSCRQRC
jgi:hypothetical protein